MSDSRRSVAGLRIDDPGHKRRGSLPKPMSTDRRTTPRTLGFATRRGPRAIPEAEDVSAAPAMQGLTRADLMTAGQVAELLDVPVSTVLEWGRNGTLPRVKLGRHVRFLRTQVEKTILAAVPPARVR